MEFQRFEYGDFIIDIDENSISFSDGSNWAYFDLRINTEEKVDFIFNAVATIRQETLTENETGEN